MVGISQGINNNFKELSIELTNKCGLNCIYCSSSASINKDEFIDIDRINSYGNKKTNEIALEYLNSNIDKICDYPFLIKL